MGTRRLGILTAVALAATTAVVATAVVVVAGEPAREQAITLAMYGVGDVPAVDGTDTRARYEITIDHTVLFAAADAVAQSGAAAGTDPFDGLTENDRALMAEVAAVGWAEDGGVPLPRSLRTAGLDGVESIDEAVRMALAVLVPSVEQVNPVVSNRYEAVGAAVTEAVLGAMSGIVGVEDVGLVVPFSSDDPDLAQQWGLVNTGQTMTGGKGKDEGTGDDRGEGKDDEGKDEKDKDEKNKDKDKDKVDAKADSLGGASGKDGAGVADVDVGFARTFGQADGSGVVVAIVDSGIQTDHPDLTGRFWSNADEDCDNGLDDDANGFVDDCRGWDFVQGDATTDDDGADNDHGTHVAGIVAATTGNGIGIASLASGASIMPLKIFDGGSAPTSRVTAAIEYAVDNGANVINLSLGGPNASASLESAIIRARDAGVLVVVAAGNAGADTDDAPMYPGSYDLANIITVGSHANDGSVSAFSNTGATSVDVFAPGERVLSTLPQGRYGYLSGTSMAAPMVAAVAAVAAQSWGTTDAATVRAKVLAAVVTDGAFRGRAATDGRVFAPFALSGSSGLGYLAAVVGGVDDIDDGIVDLSVSATLPGALEAEVVLDVQLARLENDGAYAVLDYPVAITLGGVTRHLRTDASGMLRVPGLSDAHRAELEADGLDLQVAMTVPKARYVVAIAATTAAGETLDPVAVFFKTKGGPKHIDDLPDQPVDEGPVTHLPDDAASEDDSTMQDEGAAGEPEAEGDGESGDDVVPPSGDGDAPSGDGDAPSGDGDGSDGDDGGDAPAENPDGSGRAVLDPPVDGAIGDADGSGGGGTAGVGGGGGAGQASDPGDAGAGGAPGSGAGGGEAVDSVQHVWPPSGSENGGTWVRIDGEYDPDATYYVRVGQRVHQPVQVSASAIWIVTRPHVPKLLDVEVKRRRQGRVALYRDSYTYEVDPDQPSDEPAPPTGGDATSDGPDAPGAGGGGDAPVAAGGGDATDASGGGDAPLGSGGGDAPDAAGGDDAPDGVGVGAPPSAEAPTSRVTAGAPMTAKDGMKLDRLVGGPLAGLDKKDWKRTDCRKTVRCAAVRLSG